MRMVVTCQMGVVTCQTGVVTCQTGVVTCQTGVVTCQTTQRHICCVYLFVSMVGLFGFAAFFVVIAVFATSLVGVSFAFIHCGEKSSNAQGRTRISVVCRAVVTQKARVCGVVPDDEVSAVVKTGITVAAQAEFVMFALRITLVLGKLDSWSMAGACYNTWSNCRSRGGIPVVSRKGRHRSSEVSDRQAQYIMLKVFHFAPPPPLPPHPTHRHNRGSSRRGHPDGVIQTGSSRRGHPLKITHTSLVFCFCFMSHHTYITHTYNSNE